LMRVSLLSRQYCRPTRGLRQPRPLTWKTLAQPGRPHLQTLHHCAHRGGADEAVGVDVLVAPPALALALNVPA
jgi:hypothetical protein